MEKKLLSKNILSNVQENTPNGVISFSSSLYNTMENSYKILDSSSRESSATSLNLHLKEKANYSSGLPMFLKTLILSLAIFVVGIGSAWGQVATTYSFQQTTGTYSEITGGTLLGTATANAFGTTSLDDNVYAVTGLPFTFTYNGVGYTSFNINTNGYITFGATAPAGTVYIPISSTTAYAGAISAWGRDLNALFNIGGRTGTLRWETVGTAPNREVVIQWKNFRLAYSTSTTLAPYLDFQIRLKETSNVIDIIYGPSGMAIGTSTSTTTTTAQVGLRGPNNTFATNVLNRTNTTGSINSSTAGTTNASTQSTTLGSFSSNGTPGRHTNGKIYRYAPIVVAACSGTPAPGNTLASSATVTPGGTVNLSLQTATSGTGVTYAWESGPSSSGPWTVFGTSAATQTSPAITAGTWFRCKVTCGAIPGISNPVQVTLSYCAASGTGANSWITNFVTSGGVSNISNASGFTAGGYANYTAISCSQSAGGVVNFTLNYNSDPGTKIFIDWNNDFDFNDAGENVYLSNAYVLSSVAGTITVPVGQALGNYRMRIVVDWNSTVPIACPVSINGETEDYTFSVTAPPACTSPSSLTSSSITSSSATISWAAASPAPSSGYQYYYSTSATAPAAGTTPSGSTAAGVTTASITGLTANTTYYFWVRSNCGGSGTSTWAGSSNFFTGYCTPSSASVDGSGITNVVFGTGPTVNNTTGTEAGNYGNYSAQIGALEIGASASVSITFNTFDGFSSYDYNTVIYVDWNQDFDFSDLGETVWTGLSAIASPTTLTATFTVPGTTTAGQNYRMRIGAGDASAPAACATGLSWSCFEDYTIQVFALVACSGTPNAGTATITSATGCASTNFTLNSSGLSTGAGITYQWQKSASAGGTYTDVGAAGASLTTSTATTAYYRLKTTCAGSGLVNYSNVVSYTAVSCCTHTLQLVDTFGDGWNGGSVNLYVGGILIGNYTIASGSANNINFSASSGQAIQITYTAGSYAYENYFNVLNGAGTPIVSNWYPSSSGTWNGTALCPYPPVISSFSPTSICPGNTVTITGSDFYGATGVTINGVAATYTLVSATSITATVPATTSGTIAITNTFGTGTSAGTLTINTAPATPIISVSPSATIGLGATATLTATTTGGTINWYKPMGTLVGTGTTFTTPAACVAGTHTYYAQEAGAICPSFPASQIITVNPLVASTPSNGIICSSGGSVTLNANVTGGTGFNWSPATGLSSTTAGITIASPTVTTAYTFTCTTTACGALSGTFNVGVIAPTAYTPTATPATLCTGATSLLASNLASSGFTVSPITCALSTVPASGVTTLCSGGTAVVTPTSTAGVYTLDDSGWGAVPIGFSYNFFGANYSNLNVGTNGVVQFGAYNAAALADFIFTSLPNAAEPLNIIAMAANDNNLSATGAASSIQYWTEGIAPTRVFVLYYNQAVQYATGPGFTTGQIKLFETTGNVEIHITTSTSTNNKVVGLQNFDASIGAMPLATAATITNQAWKFIPGATYGFQWSTAGAAIGGATSTTYTTPVLTTASSIPIVYTVSALNPNTGCATSNNVTVTVNASPAAPISGGTVTNCSNITPQTLTATAPIGCVVDWYGAPAPFGGSNPVLLSSSSTYSTSTAGTYYAVSRNTITGCTSGGTAIQYIQTPAPALPTATTAIAYCQGAIASALSATALAGNSINWYNSMGGAPYTVAPIPSTVTSGATNYWVAQVSGTNGCISNLLMITVTINASPAAPVAAAAGPYCQNDVAAALSATADAGNTLQWYTAVGGTASSTAITPSTVLDGTTDYYVAQLSAAGCISPLTTLSVLVNPTLTASVSNSASSTSACGGVAITFTAIPANGGTAPTYQWYLNGAPQPGETGITYTIASPVGGEAVYVEMVSNATPCLAAATVVSNTVTLTTTPSTPSVSIAVTGSSTVCFGSPITFSVASSSSLGATPTYQWQIDGFDVAGETNSTFTTVDVYPGSYVSLNVSSSILPTTCLTVVNTFSNSIYPTILDPVYIYPDPSSDTACLGTTQTFTVGATGTGTLTYQWKKAGVNITGNPSAITSTLTISPVIAGDAAIYTCVVTGTCGAVTSAGANLTIDPNTAISAQPVAVTQCELGLVTFTVTASGAGTLTYQWRKNGTNIVGANSASYSIASVLLTDAGNYSVVVGGTCGSVTSVIALLTVNPSITITAQPVSLTLCAGATANFSVTASGTGTLTYKWRFNGTLISGATSSAYSIPSITAANAGNYTVSIISSCGTVLSSTAVLTVNPVTAIVTQPVSVTPCIGTNTMFFVAATGTGTLTYQWKLDGVNIPSSNNDTLNISSVSSANAGTYSCVVSGGTCGTSSATSSFATLTTIPLPTVTTANTAIICSGSPTAISLTASAASSFAWTVGTITGTITGASAGSGASIAQTLTNPSSSTAGTVQFIVTPTSTAGSCAGAAYTITVTVNPASTVTTANTAAICSGTPTAISLTASGPSTFAWTVGAITGSITGASAGSGTSIAQTLTNPSSSTAGTVQYIVTPTATTGGCAGAPYTITVTVNPTPAITCPAPITVAATAGSCTATVSYVATSTTPGATITYSIASGSAFSVGTTSVTATATSVEGCLSTCTFNVIVTSSGTSNWIGGTSTDWFNSANWCGGVPTSTSNVTISLGSTFLPLISTTGAVCRNLTINAGATLAMNGNAYLTVSGNWVNSGTFTAIAGEVSFAGSAAQTLSGATSFINFTLNNAAGLTSSSTITINGICQLTAGVLTTGTNIVIISSGAYVIATAGYVNGYLRKSIATGSSISESFEIGSATAYTPTTLYFNSVSTAGTLTVNTVTGDHGTLSASGFNASRTINRYWKIVNAGVVFDYYDLDVNYATADMDAAFSPTFAGAKIYVTPTTVSPNAYSANYGAPNFLNFVGITEFGEVQIGVFNPVPVLSSVTPDYAYITTTSNLVVTGQGFIAGAGGSTVNALTAGVTINSTTVTSDTTLTLNITVSPTATLGVRSFAVTNPTPFGGVSDSLTITIRKKAVASFYANRTTIGCSIDGNVDFVNYSTDAVSYLWNFGAGATPATATGAGPYTVLYSSTGLKTITLTAYSPIGDSTLVRTNYINVTNVAPLVPTSISGPTSVCTSGPNKMYSIPLVAGVTSYTWTVPTGATIVSGATGATIVSGALTRTIYVKFDSTYATGTITVKQSNACGDSPIKSLVVNGQVAAPASITGPTNICSLTSATYTVSAVSGATSYSWLLPTGVTTASGASTTTTTGTSLTVYFAPGAAGNISVYSTNVCSNSASIVLYIYSTTINVPATLTGPTNICGSSTGTYTVSAVTGATSYLWTLPTGVTSTAGTSPITTTGTTLTVSYNSVATGTIYVQAANTCATSATKTITFTNSVAAPASVTGPTNSCGLITGTYAVSAVTGATGYEWTLPSGVTSTAGTSPITTTGTSLTVTYNAVTTGTILVAAKNACVTSTTISIAFTNSVSLATPATLTGPTSLCSLTAGTYTVSAVTGATSYQWTLPTGVTSTAGPSPITTTGTSLSVSFASSGAISGNISVVALNTCTTSSAKTLAISNTVATPASVTGPTNICGITSGTYTVSAVTGATGYIWTLPTGVTSAAGPSPITTSTNTLTVTYAGGLTSGTITVAAKNACIASSTVSISFITSGGTAPATPGVITGPTAVCAITSTNYSIVAVSGATSYTWTLPTGITSSAGTSPITTTSTSIPVTFGSFTSGSISVTANSCSSSAARTLALTTVPAVPATLTGTTIICGAATSYVYTVGTVASATSYIWTLPAGVSSGGVSTSVTVPAAISGPNTITLDFAPTFVSGIIYVKAYNTCGTSINKALSLTTAPLTPGVITGSAVVGACLTQETYSIAAVAGASSYTWTLPLGFTLAPGSTGFANTITVDITSFTGGTLSVVAVGCGNSPARTLAITTNVAIPASITGLLGVCGLSTATYTVAATTGAASYTWALPTGVTHASGTNPVTIPAVTTGTNTILVNFNLTTFVSGILSVNANSSCGVAGGFRSIALNVVPVTPATLTGSTFVCGVSTPITYTVSAVSGASGYTWYLPANANSGGVIDSVTTTGLTLPVTFTAGFTSGNLSVKAKSPSCGSSLPKTITISTAPITPVTLSGATNICNLSSTTYTVSATANAVSYTWTLPTGVTSTLGSSPITILAAIAPATNTITVNFAATSISGSISVTANSSCASSAPKTLALTGVTAPATPTAISGSAVVCWGTPVTYTATAVVGAISYDWTLPTGVTSGGTGGVVNTTSNSITLDFDGAFVSGSSIAVKANNRCTTSAVARTLALTTVIGTAGVITGQTSVCGLDSATYTVAATVGATSYIWTLPAGITHWSGTYPVLVTGSNTITVVFATTFTSGSLSVKAKNACATSVTARTLALTKVLATPGAFTGLTNVCGVASTTYSVAAVTGATGYKWTVPVDMTITSGLGTNSINVTISSGPGATLSNYTLSVKDTNACGESAARSMTVSNCHSYIAFSADSSDITNLDILLYPNPSLGTFNIEYNSVIKSQLKIEMYDVLGKLVFEKSETIVEGENVFRYNEEGVQKGSYFIKLTDEQNKMFISKILVVQ